MTKQQHLCACSAAAVLASVGMWTTAAQAQAAKTGTEVGEVVVTGSLIAGTPEDAALPVNVIGVEDLKKLGQPNNMEIVRQISEIGMIQGESNRYNGLQPGVGSVNLRNLVSSRSIVIFNGRRLPDQIGGISQNTNMVPNAAIGRVEVLKDGGATAYGADAVGGVVNFITRKNFDGFEVNAGTRYIPGAEDLEYDGYLLGGKAFERGNILAVISYSHRSDLRAMERDWTQRDYLDNNHFFAWTSAGSPGSYVPQTRSATGVFANATVPTGRAISITGIVRDPICTELGGFAGFSATPSPVCYWHLSEYDFIQEEQNTTQAYAEGNYRLTDNFRIHGELTYSQIDIPATSISPGEGPARNPDGTTTASPAVNYQTPGTNPAVARFLQEFGYASTVISNITNPAAPGRVALPLQAWRLFGAGGNPLTANGLDDSQHNTNESWRGTLTANWDIGDLLYNQLSLEAAATYQYTNYSVSTKDIISQRLQMALSGVGGPSCNGIRADLPGSSGCYYFNPFSSAIPDNPANGMVNPTAVTTGSFAGYDPGTGLQNSPTMLNWLYEPIWIEREQDFYVYDLILRGTSHWNLWGGPVKWAVGGQYRLTENSRRLSDLANIGDAIRFPTGSRGPGTNPCPIGGQQPGQTVQTVLGPITCTTGTNAVGPFLVGPFGNRATTVLQGGARFNEDRRFPVYSSFFEVNLPILDTLQVNLSGRWEKFISDQTNVDNEVFVPAGSVRWQATPNLALRLTAGETFSQVNPEIRRFTDGTFNASTRFGGNNPTATRTYENDLIKPEKGFNYNVGAIVSVGGFQGTLDYFNIKIDDYVGRTLGSTDIVNAALSTPGTVGGNPTLNCSSGLITQSVPELDGASVLTLAGPCAQGVTRVTDITRITFANNLNSGTLSTSGLDATARVLFQDVWGGSLMLSTDVTYYLTYEVSALEYQGVTIAPGWEGLGYLNESTVGGKNGQHVTRFRGSFAINYSRDRHNLNLSFRYIDSIRDDRTDTFVPGNATNSNPGNTASCLGSGNNINSNPADAGQGEGVFNAACNVTILYGMKIDDWWVADFTYRVQLPWDATATFTVNNVIDKKPPFARYGLSYDPYLYSPLGRNFRMTVTKRF